VRTRRAPRQARASASPLAKPTSRSSRSWITSAGAHAARPSAAARIPASGGRGALEAFLHARADALGMPRRRRSSRSSARSTWAGKQHRAEVAPARVEIGADRRARRASGRRARPPRHRRFDRVDDGLERLDEMDERGLAPFAQAVALVVEEHHLVARFDERRHECANCAPRRPSRARTRRPGVLRRRSATPRCERSPRARRTAARAQQLQLARRMRMARRRREEARGRVDGALGRERRGHREREPCQRSRAYYERSCY
jgi:hypothetical protein